MNVWQWYNPSQHLPSKTLISCTFIWPESRSKFYFSCVISTFQDTYFKSFRHPFFEKQYNPIIQSYHCYTWSIVRNLLIANLSPTPRSKKCLKSSWLRAWTRWSIESFYSSVRTWLLRWHYTKLSNTLNSNSLSWMDIYLLSTRHISYMNISIYATLHLFAKGLVSAFYASPCSLFRSF